MEAIQPYIDQIAALLRSLIEQFAPQAKTMTDPLTDTALVGAAGGAIVVALILLITIMNVIGGLFRKKEEPEEEHVPPAREVRREPERAIRAEPRTEPRPAPRPEPRPEPRQEPRPVARAPEPPRQEPRPVARAPEPTRPDPVEKLKADASASVERMKGEADNLFAALAAERDRAAAGGAAFAQIIPTTALRLLAESLAEAGEPAVTAAKRKVLAGDFNGARADFRRHVEGPGSSNASAWRDAGTLECMDNLENAIAALESSIHLDPRQFVTQIMIRRLYSGTGKLDEGRAAAEAAVPIAGSDRERAIAYDELGEACMFQKDREGAIASFKKGLEITRSIAARNPNDKECQRDLAVGYYKIASVAENDSREYLAQAVATFEKLKASGRIEPEDENALTQLKAALGELDKQIAAKKA